MKNNLLRRVKPVTVFNTYLGNGVTPEPEHAENLQPAVGYKKVFLRINDLNKVELVSPTFETVIRLISRAECHNKDGVEDHLKQTNGKMSIGFPAPAVITVSGNPKVRSNTTADGFLTRLLRW